MYLSIPAFICLGLFLNSDTRSTMSEIGHGITSTIGDIVMGFGSVFGTAIRALIGLALLAGLGWLYLVGVSGLFGDLVLSVAQPGSMGHVMAITVFSLAVIFIPLGLWTRDR